MRGMHGMHGWGKNSFLIILWIYLIIRKCLNMYIGIYNYERRCTYLHITLAFMLITTKL